MKLCLSGRHTDFLPSIRMTKHHPLRRLILAHPLPPPVLMTMLTLLQAENAVSALALARQSLDRVTRSFAPAVCFLGFEVATVGSVMLLETTLGFGEVRRDTARHFAKVEP